jgi:hypothetical protein
VGDVRRLAVGVEHLLGARVSVRGGVHASTAGAARPAGAFGASVAVTSTAWIDFHVTRGGHDAEHRWGVGGRVGF